MVEIENLKKCFGPFTAVQDVSFEVKKGEVLGFLGPNGAGKSTTMKMITGFLTPTAGRVSVAGFDIETQPLEVKRRIGYLPEGAPAYPDMTPLEFLDFIAQIRGFQGKEKQQRIDKTIEQINLQSVLNQSIETLSKGFKRRVGLAQAILHDPEVLIMDEPTDGLDPNQKHEVRNLIRSMAAEKVIILSTHILEEVDAVCSRAIIIANGRIVADGTPANLEARAPLHNAVTLTLNAAASQADNIYQQLLDIKDVAKVEQQAQSSEQSLSYRLIPERRCSIISEVSRLSREQNWSIAELHVAQGRLDDVFRQITV